MIGYFNFHVPFPTDHIQHRISFQYGIFGSEFLLFHDCIVIFFVLTLQESYSECGNISTLTVKGQKNVPVIINVKKGETKNQCPQQ